MFVRVYVIKFKINSGNHFFSEIMYFVNYVFYVFFMLNLFCTNDCFAQLGIKINI